MRPAGDLPHRCQLRGAGPLHALNGTDARGLPLDEALGTTNAARVVSGFNPATGLIEYRQMGPSGSATLQNLAYEWDDNDNLTRRADLNQAGSCTGPGYSARLCETFVYDALNRIDSSQRNGSTNLDLAYDAIGNLTAKTSPTETAENIGSYNYVTAQSGCSYYSHNQPHAVRNAGGVSYCYDANGNMVKRGSSTVSWYSYNLPNIINGAGQSSQFWYTPDRNRWKQVATYPSGSETTIYVGGILEKVTVPSGTLYRHYLQAGSVEVVVTRTGSTQTVRYIASDSLGSGDVMLDSAGNSLVKMSFSAFGRRRGSSWTGAPSGADLTAIDNATRHGFTGHEMLDNLGLTHMNGRVYDPAIGRFMSADPYIQAPYYSQSLNRYAYVWNNPLSLTDPSGFETVRSADSPDGNRSPDTSGAVYDVGRMNHDFFWPSSWFTGKPRLGANFHRALSKPTDGGPSGDPAAIVVGSTYAVAAGRAAARQPQVALGALAVGGIVAAYLSVSPTFQGAFRIPDLMSGKDFVPPVSPLDMGGQAQDPCQADPDCDPGSQQGAGPVLNTIEVSDRVASTQLFQNFAPRQAVEFVYDPGSGRMLVSTRPLASGHPSLARALGADFRTVVGGTLRRGASGQIWTTEHSGHFYGNWNRAVRDQFVRDVERATGQTVRHFPGL